MRPVVFMLTLLMAIFSYVTFVFYRAWDYDKPLNLFNDNSWYTESDFPGVEDINMFGDVAIGVTSDYVEVNAKTKDTIIQKGGLVLIDPKE